MAFSRSLHYDDISRLSRKSAEYMSEYINGISTCNTYDESTTDMQLLLLT